MQRIEKSGFRKGEYVGYANGVWLIRKRADGSWVARKRDDPSQGITISARTLRELDSKLGNVEENLKQNPSRRAPRKSAKSLSPRKRGKTIRKRKKIVRVRKNPISQGWFVIDFDGKIYDGPFKSSTMAVKSAKKLGGLEKGFDVTFSSTNVTPVRKNPVQRACIVEAVRIGQRKQLSFWYWNGHALEDKRTHAFQFPNHRAAYAKAKEIRDQLPSGFRVLRVVYT